MSQKGFANIALVIVVVILSGAVGYFAFVKKSTSPVNTHSSNQVVNNEVVNKPFISPSQKTIDSDKEIEFTFSAVKDVVQSKVYLSCESGLIAYFGDNITPRTPTPYPNICNTWKENRWDTIQPDPKFVRDIRDIKFRNDSTGGKVATLQMTVTMPGNLSVKSDISTVNINPKPTTSSNKTTNWQGHSNIDIGFSFKYPSTWKVDDGLKINTCCLNVFNSMNPYQGDFLKQGVMKAQFQYHVDASIVSKQQYIDSLIKGTGESEMGTPISKSSIVSVQNENGLDITKFNGGVGNVGYVIPRKQNFSEVIYVIVWNPDSTFEKVLSTLNLTN